MGRVAFSPNPAQERFLRAFRKDLILLLCSGVGIGKTYVLAYAAFRLATLNPGVNGLIVSHVLNHVRTEIIPLVIAFLKESGLYAGETKMDREIHLTHGGSIQYGSADTPKTLDGKNVGWLLGDEIRYWPRASYDKATSRVRVKGAYYPMQAFTTTPEMNWIYDEFADRSDRVVIHGRTEENAANLQEGYYDRLASSLAPGTYSQYVEGQWVSSTGSVYGQEFSKEFSFCHLPHVPGVPVVLGIDPGTRYPAVVFAQHLPFCAQHGTTDCLHILGEIVEDEVYMSRLLPKVKAYAYSRGWELGRAFLDPFGGRQRESSYGTRASDLLEEAGLEVVYSYDPQDTNVINGIDVVKSRLLNVAGERRLFISEDLNGHGLTARNIARAIQSYRWPERKPGQPARENPVHDETSHVMDALRYICVNLFPMGSKAFIF